MDDGRRQRRQDRRSQKINYRRRDRFSDYFSLLGHRDFCYNWSNQRYEHAVVSLLNTGIKKKWFSPPSGGPLLWTRVFISRAERWEKIINKTMNFYKFRERQRASFKYS